MRADSYAHLESAGCKICSWCGEEKALDQFWKNKNARHGRDSYCKDCRKDRDKTRYSKDRKRILSKSKTYRTENAEKIKLQRQQAHRYKRYGLTEEEFIQIWESQEGKCSICTRPLDLANTKGMIRACMDHDHKTGKNRGILCNLCNVGLGSFKDNEEFLQNAIEYLRRFNAQNS